MDEKKMSVDVECYSPFICLNCPVFDLDTTTLFAGDEPYERHFRCSHLPFCQRLLPKVEAFYEAKLSAKEKPPVGTSRWIHDGPSFRGGVDWWHCDNCGKMVTGVQAGYHFCPDCGFAMVGGDEDA